MLLLVTINYWLNKYSYALIWKIAVDIFKDDKETFNYDVIMTTTARDSTQVANGCIKTALKKMKTDSSYSYLNNDIIQVIEIGRDQAHGSANVVNNVKLSYIINNQNVIVNENGDVSEEGINIFEFFDHKLLRGGNIFEQFNLGYNITYYPDSIMINVEEENII